MPWNSQSPLILGLNELFSRPRANTAPIGSTELKAGARLSDRAGAYPFVAPTAADAAHIDGWPQDHQDLLRGVLVLAIEQDLPTSFAWEEVELPAQTRTIIVSFGRRLGATFRSPYYVEQI